MTVDDFMKSRGESAPPMGVSVCLAALWWDAKGDWVKAHGLVDELETREGMAVHAYLHRKEGAEGNAEYWYRRAGGEFRRATLAEEWEALVSWLCG